MWVAVLLFNLLGRKLFLRFLGGWVLIMLFFLYCFVHEGFDQPRQTQRLVVPHMQHRPVAPVPTSTPEP
jgi:hypothetical protein